MKFLLLTFVFLFNVAHALDQKEFDKWEARILLEIQKHEKTQPEKAYFIYLTAARELTLFKYKVKAAKYYQKALKLNPANVDKTEIYIQLINLNRNDKKAVATYLQDLEVWLKENPASATSHINEWIKVVKSYAEGKTNAEEAPAFINQWATDEKIKELLKENKFKEAFVLLSNEQLEKSDINSKIEYDLLSSVVVGKETPRLYCEPMLKESPHSISWSMRICRYLSDWKQGKPSSESLSTIQAQLESEAPKRIHYLEALKRL